LIDIKAAAGVSASIAALSGHRRGTAPKGYVLRGLGRIAGVVLTFVLVAVLLRLPSGAAAGSFVVDAAAVSRLRQVIEIYRAIASGGGWPSVEGGPTLHPGDADPRVPALRVRLTRTGDMAEGAGAPANVYDPELVRAVRRFQSRHGLIEDGIVGLRTLAALDVPPERRAETLARNLDRLRDLVARLPREAAIVNIPAFTLMLQSEGRTVLETRVIVGRPSWPTPLLESAIDRIEINPYWNVPPRIASRELAPKIAADPAYLVRNRMRVLAGPPGQVAEIDPASVNWARFGRSGYRLRQDPGPSNPLGVIKFAFPNLYDVYLHDTPEKANFNRDMRALSHGCVRAEDAFALAARLLAADPRWSEDALRAAIETGEYRQVRLAKPMPILFVYLTGWVDGAGAVQFRPDLYRKDEGPPPGAGSESCGKAVPEAAAAGARG